MAWLKKTHVPTLNAAEALFRALPPLVVQALTLAQALHLGEHPRKTAGAGSQFFEYAPYTTGQSTTEIDWRASARHETLFTRKTEKEKAQKTLIWVENSALMHWHSRKELPLKGERAMVIALAFAALLLEGQEVIYPASPHLKPFKGGVRHLPAVFETLENTPQNTETLPNFTQAYVPGVTALFVGAFTLNPHALLNTLHNLRQQNITPLVVDVIDPAEATFPYKGAIAFNVPLSQKNAESFKTQAAQDLKTVYLHAWQKNQTLLQEAVPALGGHYLAHRTNEGAAHPLRALLGLLSRRAV